MYFSEQEVELMQRIGLEHLDLAHPENLSSDDWIEIEEVVGERLQVYETKKRGDDYCSTPDGVICEDILEKLARNPY